MAALAAVTFDFNDTLVQAEDWLRLETVTLAEVVLAHLAAEGRLPPDVTMRATQPAAQAAYRAIRVEASSSGREVSALEGVSRVLAGIGLAAAVDPGALAAAVAATEHACLATTSVIPGVPAVLEELRTRGLRLAVVSSAAYTPFVEWGLARHDLAGAFAVVATSAATGYYKTDPRLYAWALDRLGVDPAAAVHVGDHPRFDVQGAQAAGLRAILFTAGAPAVTPAAHPDCHPDAIIVRMADLPAALARFDS